MKSNNYSFAQDFRPSLVSTPDAEMNRLEKMSSRTKYYLKRLYIICWHELSLDPAVRKSPFDDPPENEVKLTTGQKFGVRLARIYFLAFHLLGFLGLYYCLTGQVKLYTILWTLALGYMALIGMSAGAHRMLSHQAFKATWQLRLILMIFQTLSVQYSLHTWAQQHRIHHKFVDTDSDPHNSRRGFFFSHIGWNLILYHPDFVDKTKTIDMKDVERDKIFMFQYKYYVPLVVVLAYVIPTIVPYYFWNENLWLSHVVSGHLRYMLTLHSTCCVNSIAHLWGNKPYEKNIYPSQNMFVQAVTFGDGWHNFHHVFPWDYRSAELGSFKLFNLPTAFIDFFALIGWAYDLKTVSPDIVYKRVKRTGDGSHHVWGETDDSMSPQDSEIVKIRYKEIS